MMQTYYSLPNQSMWDICLNTYQALEYMVKLCKDNGVDTFSYLPRPNTPFLWDDSLALVQPGTPYIYATAQIINTFSLDRYTKAIAAYSMTSLYENYGGYCMRVRRSSDNTERDIGFLPDGSFDIITFESFIGANTAYVVKWYDQTGHGYHWTQTTAAYQITTDGTDLIFHSTGTGGDKHFLVQSDIFGSSAPAGQYYHTFFVAKNDGPMTASYSFKTLLDYDSEGGALSKGWGIRQGNLTVNVNNMQFWNAGSPGGYTLYINGAKYPLNQVALPSPTNWRVYDMMINGFNTQGTNKFLLGVNSDYGGTSTSWNGRVKELIIYNRNMTDVQYDIMTDIMQKYGIG